VPLPLALRQYNLSVSPSGVPSVGSEYTKAIMKRLIEARAGREAGARRMPRYHGHRPTLRDTRQQGPHTGLIPATGGFHGHGRIGGRTHGRPSEASLLLLVPKLHMLRANGRFPNAPWVRPFSKKETGQATGLHECETFRPAATKDPGCPPEGDKA
jgi:hypothetical protein